MIVLDFETKSEADLKKVGADVYAWHPSTEIICLCYKIDDGPIHDWTPGLPAPTGLLDAVHAGWLLEAFNVGFERSIWSSICNNRLNWPSVGNEQWRDLQAVAAYYSLPQALDPLAKVLGGSGKDPEGTRLITKYSKLYLKTAKRVIPPEDLEAFVRYCRKDVQDEYDIGQYLGELPERELPVFLLDQLANARGLYLDEAGILAAEKIVDARAEELTAKFRKIVGCAPAQHAKVLAWVQAQGVETDNLQADTIEELLEGELPTKAVRQALDIRMRISKASTKKLVAMLNQRSSDGRARFQTKYHGARTGRNTGQGIQPLNLNRGFKALSEWEDLKPEQLVSDIMRGDPEYLDMIYGDATDAVAKATRHWITAAPGYKLVSGDYVSIEAVLLACLAGEEWKIEAFRSGAKIYERMAEKIYNLPEGTVTKKTHPLERQDGKTGELAFGYQGALNAWLKFDSSGRHGDETIIGFVRSWRKEHPMTVELWRGLEREAIQAVITKKPRQYRQIGFEMVDEWLTMILPDGKRLWYYDPQIRMTMPAWHDPEVEEACAEGTCGHKPRPALTYMAYKNKTFRREFTYGGKLTENAVQATSRQILAPAALRAEAAGYRVILTVYDEIVTEVPKGFGSLKEFAEIMAQCPGDWAKGWPIRVDPSEGERYSK